MIVLIVKIPIAWLVVAMGDSHFLCCTVELSPHLFDHFLGVGCAVDLGFHKFKAVHLGLRLECKHTLEFTLIRRRSNETLDEMLCVLLVIVGLLLLANVVVAVTERSLPVFLEQIGMILLVHWARAWRRESVLETVGDLIVLLASDTAC